MVLTSIFPGARCEFIQNIISGVASLQAAANMSVETGGVAYWAHIGGFVAGLILAPVLGIFNRDGWGE